MASGATTKAARRAAREAVTAAQEEQVRRTRANGDDLAKFFTARARAETVERSVKERVEALQEDGKGRRDKQLVQQGAALRAMRDRGEDLAEIARLAGIDPKTVRELIRIVEQKPEQPCQERRRQWTHSAEPVVATLPGGRGLWRIDPPRAARGGSLAPLWCVAARAAALTARGVGVEHTSARVSSFHDETARVSS
jgi:hypothetical protein